MAYKFNSGTGQQVFVENQGTQTLITLMSSQGTQQQSSSTGFTTGMWVSVPVVFATRVGFVLELTTTEGKLFFNIQGNSISLQPDPGALEGQALSLEEVIMPAMKPMEPMKMGNMEMKMNPTMEMRLGGMQMSMGNAVINSEGKNFCSQCGSALQAGDRFCSHCGHKLS